MTLIPGKIFILKFNPMSDLDHLRPTTPRQNLYKPPCKQMTSLRKKRPLELCWSSRTVSFIGEFSTRTNDFRPKCFF